VKKGIVLDELPPARRRPDYDWDSVANTAKENPGKPVLAYEDVPLSRIASVRQRRRPPFVEDGGRIIVTMRDSYEADHTRYGNVFFTWEPTTTTKEEK
jgi:hypothetical protein